jgi:DNA repair protein RadA/Sms
VKPKISYICTSCQYKNPAWAGQCPQCGEWNTMQEQVEEAQTKRTTGLKSAPTRTTSINAFEKSENRRIKTGIEELDRTIGGGFLQSSFTLLTGEPGIGKSTLTLQIAHAIANQNKKVLIISGEESEYQLQERAHRLNTTNKNIQIANESRLETIIATTELEKPEFLIIDSIQVVGTDMIPSTPGSITQVRFCTEELLGYCKKNSITTIIIGHVTKDGLLAGPKTLEHLVDTVLQFEGDRYQQLRILRTSKNRFGSTNEIGIFKMSEKGLEECPNPSEEILTHRTEDKVGSILSLIIEGSRPIVVEIQALVTQTHFGYPKRTTSGYDLNRLNLLIAVLQKHFKVDLNNYDVYINVTGGIRVRDPITDQAVIEALISSYRRMPIPKNRIAIGEMSLTGDIIENLRLKEALKQAEKMGLSK